MPTSTPRTALITGASSGIGRATALSLAKAGVRVAVNARRKEKLDELVAQIETAGGQALALPCDAADTPSIDQLWQDTVDWAGGIPDIVVANAGRGLQGGVLTSDPEAWASMFQLNVLGTLHLMRIAATAMVKAQNPVHTYDIVVLGSNVGTNISPFSSVYGATKFAIESAAEALRRDVGKDGIRITSIKPGIVISEFQEVAGYNHENFGKTVEKFGKPLEPDDIAQTIRFILEQPPHINVNQITIRPTGQDYP